MSVVYTVLRQSREYTIDRVERLRAQLGDVPCVTLSDTPILNRIKLKHDWPGWWSKMELFRPDIAGDIFYLDLDTTVLANVRPFMSCIKTTLLSDFYRPQQLQSSMMFVTEEDRARIWEAWMRGGPDKIMRDYGSRRAGFNGDQNFIDDTMTGQYVNRWQLQFPGRVISYKVDVRDRIDAGDAPRSKPDIVIFHGRPRPWEVTLPW